MYNMYNMYYYALLRYHISNRIHMINRKNLDKSWKNVTERKRKLRVIASRKSYMKQLIKYKHNNFS